VGVGSVGRSTARPDRVLGLMVPKQAPGATRAAPFRRATAGPPLCCVTQALRMTVLRNARLISMRANYLFLFAFIGTASPARTGDPQIHKPDETE